MGPSKDADRATAASLACGWCGNALPPGSRFCNQCGSPVTSTPATAEYKQVTVLFADVVRSMDIAARVDIERLRDLMTEVVQRSAAVVRRFGGTVEYTGDGVMATFGAPAALEDHAFRACLAAVELQQEAARLAVEVASRDGVALQLRVGLNSGRVIAGSGSLGYAATVGFAQRMESAAPAGGVLCSESTARLVEGAVTLADPELVHIKGSDVPVGACRLLAIPTRRDASGRIEATLVGRHREMAALAAAVDRAVGGHGGVVAVVGPPGIGKSRTTREVAALAADRGFEVCWAFCESHASDIPFQAVARLLRASAGVADLDARAARTRIRDRLAYADPQDLLLLDDLLGIGDPEVPSPPIHPDARRRRLTALVNAANLARKTPTLFVIEDVHWIDAISESMLADFLAVMARTPSLALITARPEYRGPLVRAHGVQTVTLDPLGDADTAALITEVLGPDHSVGELVALIADRAAGNPFFAQEMVRELAQSGVLTGERGRYGCARIITDVSVPATVQAAIAARIDRLSTTARRTINAAAVIGTRFEAELLTKLGIDPALEELLDAELIDQARMTPQAEYAFHHPLIRAVAYESQLKSDRVELHRRVAAAIQERDPEALEENAPLIAEHLQTAGDLNAAFNWHMRAGSWSANRDIGAARRSWEFARKIADALPADHPNWAPMRIAPRTLLCGSGWRGDYTDTCNRFEELSELCLLTGDNTALAIGMTGVIGDHYMGGRLPDASRWADEQMALVESISDPILTVALSVVACVAKHETAEFPAVLQWSNRAIQLAGDDQTIGNLFVGSPLAVSLAQRGFARWALGKSGWQQDFERAIATSLATDPISYMLVINTKYTPGITSGLVLPDDRAIAEITQALRIAEKSADDVALGLARTALGIALVHRDSTEDRACGLNLLEQLHDMCMNKHYYMGVLDFGDVYIARERARLGDSDRALARLRIATDQMFNVAQLGAFVPAIATLVEVLLQRGDDGDVLEAEVAIGRLASAPLDQRFVAREVWLPRLRALLARTQGDETAYRDYRDRYGYMAASLGFEGHMKWAQAMP